MAEEIKPMAHQQKALDETRHLEYFAFMWEMRVGKTWPLIKTMEHWHTAGKINSVLVLSPSGVHIEWIRKHLPKFAPGAKALEWNSGKAQTKGFQRLLEACMADKTSLFWLSMNAEALSTDYGKEVVKQMAKNKAGLIVDEVDIFKNPSSKRSKILHRLAPSFCPRRIASGTPNPLSPFDSWSEYHILSPDILGTKFVPFKQRYGVFKRVRFGGPAFDQLVSYRDLDQLQAILAKHSSRLLQTDVYDNLPDEIPGTIYYEMSPEIKRVYDQMHDDMMVQLDSGEIYTVNQALTWMLRLQQISRGYLPTDTGEVDLGPKPSIRGLMDYLERDSGKVIIWCRFKHDVDEILKAIAEKEAIKNPNFEKVFKAVRHDGNITKEERADNRDLFNSDENVRWLVGTPETGGVGVDFAFECNHMVIYSHSYNFRTWKQGRARIQGFNQKLDKLFYTDVICSNGKDEAILENLTKKGVLQGEVTGDNLRAKLKEIMA